MNHLHLHIIPRYRGDTVDPLSNRGPPDLLGRPPHVAPLVTGSDEDPLLPHLLAHLDRTRRIDIAVAFVLTGGIDSVEARLVDLLDRGGEVRFLTGDYLEATDPGALLRLLDLRTAYPGRVELRVYEARDRSFHPKTYIFHGERGTGLAFIGSSNLTRTALVTGVEWNYRVASEHEPHAFRLACEHFVCLYQDPATTELTEQWIADYRSRRDAYRLPRLRQDLTPDPSGPVTFPEEALIADAALEELAEAAAPRPIQREALHALAATRFDGNRAGLVVLATGLGKTWLAAFDAVRATGSHRTGGGRVLFVAHREEILGQALRVFRHVDPSRRLGFFTGTEKVPNADVVFASIQTLSRPEHLDRFTPVAFAYVVVDEFHHASADTYRRVIDHFEPDFLLGLTATPERADGGDLLALCGENLVFRADLYDGIWQRQLVPFHYYGVPDDLDYDQIPWRSGRFDPDAFTHAAATQARAANAHDQLLRRGGTRTLAFCASIRHADHMCDYLTARGLRAVGVHSGPDSTPRGEAIDRLARGDLDVVLTVDMFNEGVDIPTVDTVLMLRPTESRLLWLQQIGRGLRLAEGKDRLTVIDYVGNHRAFLTQLRALFDLEGNPALLQRQIARIRETNGDLVLPGGCHVTYELESIDILERIAPSAKGVARIREWIQNFAELHDRRPTAVEAYHDRVGLERLPRSLRTWPNTLRTLHLGLLSEGELAVLDHAPCVDFLEELHTTSMTKSYEMLTLLALAIDDTFFSGVPIHTIAPRFRRLARRAAPTILDVTMDLENTEELERLLREHPIRAWLGRRAPD